MRSNAVPRSEMRAAVGALFVAFLAGVVLIGLAAANVTAAQAKKAKTKGPDLPYKTIDHPQFVAASQASFLGPKDIVLGVTDGKTAKAYPAAILSQHGVVQDSTAKGPIAITW